MTTTTKYRTIVVDPPWDHSDGTGKGYGLTNVRRGEITLPPYSVLSLDDIKALPVRGMADNNAHLYLWTTNRYLRDAYDIAETWGFVPVKPIVWCKAPHGFFGGAFTSSVEFCLFARRGSLPHLAKAGRQWFEWPRGPHSAKPEAFLDLVETVSPGPYLEMFARRQRLGWDTWGNECFDSMALASTTGAIE